MLKSIAMRQPKTNRRTWLKAGMALPISLGGGLVCAAATDTPRLSVPRYKSLSAKTPDGVNIAIQEWGNPSGPALILIHGLNQSRLTWLRQLNSPLLERYRVITYDLRGHGDSDKPTTESAYAEGARWGDELATVIDATGVRRAAVVGWSLGGVVIVNYLARHGHDRLAAINFVDAWTKPDPAFYTEEAGQLAEALMSADLLTRLEAIRAFLQACFQVQPDRRLFELMLTFNAMPPVEVHKGIARVTFDGADQALRALRIPVLATHGAKDRLFQTGMARYTAGAAPGGQVSIYDNIGHTPFIEDSRRFNAELQGLLTRAFA